MIPGMLGKQDTLRVVADLLKRRSRRAMPLSLTTLAARSGWSPSYLQRSFRTHLGESPKRYQQRLCLEEAALALQQTEHSILDIALASGHQSHEVFSRAFRRQFKCSPSQYRARARQQNHSDASEHSSQVSASRTAGEGCQVAVVRQVGPCIGLFHTNINDSKRNHDVSTSDIELLDMQAIPVLYIQRRVPHAGMQALFAECFPKLYGHCMQHAFVMAGNPVARYVDFSPGMATIDCIIPLQQPAPGPDEDEIQAGELQGGPTLRATHTGPYETLNETYAVLENWLQEKGMARNGPNWEWYVTDPGDEPDPANWRTEVYFPVQPDPQAAT